jgi:hypothetical protein
MFRRNLGAPYADSDSVESRLKRPALRTLFSPLVGVPLALLALYGPGMVPVLLNPSARSEWGFGFIAPAFAVAPDADLGIVVVVAFFFAACVLAGWFISLSVSYWLLSRLARSIALDAGSLGSKSDRTWLKSATIGAILMGPGGALVAFIGLVAASFVA